MAKIQWQLLPREKWVQLRDRAKQRQISEEDLSNWRSGKPKILTYPTATGSRISERSNCVAPQISKYVSACWTGCQRQAVVTGGCRSARYGVSGPANIKDANLYYSGLLVPTVPKPPLAYLTCHNT